MESSEPDSSFQAGDFGAVGDGTTLNTAAIQRAIDAAALADGGTVVFAPGTYLTGSLFVKSGVTLRMDPGVTLMGSKRIEDYPVLPTRVAGIEMVWPAALVNVYEQSDVAITGEGTIDGNGKIFWDSYWALRQTYEPRGLRWASDYDACRPRLLQVFNSTRVHIGGGLLLRRSGFWTLHICYSTHVSVDRVTIRNNEDGRGPSTDGIDIDSSQHVLVQHADIAVNDDALCFKAGRDADGLRVARCTEDVIVRDCIVRDGAAGVTFGSETSGGFRNIEVHGITVLDPVPVGILFKSARSRGGFGERLRLHDITMVNVPVVLRVMMNWNPSYSYAAIPPGECDSQGTIPAHWHVLATPVPEALGKARFRDVEISALRATGASTAFEVDGFPEAPLERFTFKDIDIEAHAGGHIHDAHAWRFFDTCLTLAQGQTVQLPEAPGPLSVQGLPVGSFSVDAQCARRDVSSLSFAQQDQL